MLHKNLLPNKHVLNSVGACLFAFILWQLGKIASSPFWLAVTILLLIAGMKIFPTNAATLYRHSEYGEDVKAGNLLTSFLGRAYFILAAAIVFLHTELA